MIRVGVLMGGISREREISFAGGRTVCDNLPKSLFEVIPIFIDALGTFIKLKPALLYKGTIRDFYPPAHLIPKELAPYPVDITSVVSSTDSLLYQEIIAAVGTRLSIEELSKLIDVAFLTLHGIGGEDGRIQGLLDWYQIPYTGTAILGSAIAIDKNEVKTVLHRSWKIRTPDSGILDTADPNALPFLERYMTEFYKNKPIILKNPHQGSSIGVEIVTDVTQLPAAWEKVRFRKTVAIKNWQQLSPQAQHKWLSALCDSRYDIGFPLTLYIDNHIISIQRPDVLAAHLHQATADFCTLEALDTPQEILFEVVIEGSEFSVIVLQTPEGKPCALPVTEIVKPAGIFDYRKKYLPGAVKKRTPAAFTAKLLKEITLTAERVFDVLRLNSYARLDGLVDNKKRYYFNDPNTTSGMLPGSFFFQQAAAIGLTPGQLLTYIIYNSLQARSRQGNRKAGGYYQQLHTQLQHLKNTHTPRLRVAVMMGGDSSERHISLESGRNIFEKLSTSPHYTPLPLFLAPIPPKEISTINSPLTQQYSLWQLPPFLLLKDNADDITQSLLKQEAPLKAADKIHRQFLQQRIENAATIHTLFDQTNAVTTATFIPWQSLTEIADFVFIALHGRPGEDGQIQTLLETLHIPYNGSSPAVAALTIDKFKTNELLAAHQFSVPPHALIDKNTDLLTVIQQNGFTFPLIAKPVDDGCSSAVMKIEDITQLQCYADGIFRNQQPIPHDIITTFKLKPDAEFPQKDRFIIETLIQPEKDEHLIEITVGLLTHPKPNEPLLYEVFSPSETVTAGSILTLEEKFLAGEGLNITPARLIGVSTERQHQILHLIQQQIQQAAAVLGIEGYARIDAFVRYSETDFELIFIEVNTLPGMTPATCIFHQAALHHYSPLQFIEKIIAAGISRHQLQHQKE